MNFIQLFNLKRFLMLLFTCLFTFSSGIKAIANPFNKRSIATGKRALGILKKDFNICYLSPSDTFLVRSKAENAEDWEVLFDGSNTNKWRGKDSDTFPSNGWVVKNKSLFLNKEGAGDIITREKFSSFELVLDFSLTINANSGIKYFAGKMRNKKTGEIVMNGPEYQIIDDYNNVEVKDHKHDLGATASCYLLYEPKNIKLLPAGQWNHIKIIAKGKHVEHWLNDVKVLQYERGSEDFRKRKATTKFKDYEDYGELPEGYILLTDHMDKVFFRNIKIRRL